MPDPSKCKIGAVIDIDVEEPILVHTIAPPANGRLVFTANKARLVVGSTTTTPVETEWKDQGPLARDFACANNWVLASNNSNPKFSPPCYRDIVDLSQVRNSLLFGFLSISFISKSDCVLAVLRHHAHRPVQHLCSLCR